MTRGQILKADSIRGHWTRMFSYAPLGTWRVHGQVLPEAQSIYICLRINFLPHVTIIGKKYNKKAN